MENVKDEAAAGLDWNASIEDDSDGYALLEPGDYNAVIRFFERAHFDGSERLPPCDMAVLTLAVDTEDGPREVRARLYLCKRMEWRLSEFFRAIGRKKHGQRLRMSWEGLVGLPLRVHIGIRTYPKDGEERRTNAVTKFLDYDPEKMPREPAWLGEAMRGDETEPLAEVF